MSAPTITVTVREITATTLAVRGRRMGYLADSSDVDDVTCLVMLGLGKCRSNQAVIDAIEREIKVFETRISAR